MVDYISAPNRVKLFLGAFDVSANLASWRRLDAKAASFDESEGCC
jgi:hypothetical protein